MPKVKVNDVHLWYQLEGSGDPIAQFHGLTIGHVNFAAVTPLLAREFLVLDFDCRGYGESDKPVQEYTMDTWVDDLAGLLDALDLKSAHIHSNSMGGILFAANYPEKTRSLILDATLARFDKAGQMNVSLWKAMTDAYGWTEPVWELFALQLFSRSYIESDRFPQGMALLKQSAAANTPKELFAQFSRIVEEADMVPFLSKIEAPTLIIVGELDVLAPAELGPSGAGGKMMSELIPDARLAIIKGCGHTNMFERPEETAEVILDFLHNVKS
jgi:3-oxoadipate enol-lactonase